MKCHSIICILWFCVPAIIVCCLIPSVIWIAVAFLLLFTGFDLMCLVSFKPSLGLLLLYNINGCHFDPHCIDCWNFSKLLVISTGIQLFSSWAARVTINLSNLSLSFIHFMSVGINSLSHSHNSSLQLAIANHNKLWAHLVARLTIHNTIGLHIRAIG